MDMNTFRSDLHIAHQSRRDKLRVQNDHHSNPPHHHLGGVYINTMNLDHHHPGLNYDRRPGHGNICYDPSELLSFPPAMYPQKDGFQDAGKRSYDQNFSRNDVVVEDMSTVMSSDPQYFSTWKSIGSQSSSDYSSIFVGNALSGSSMENINSNPNPMSALDVKPAYLGYQELNSPLSNNPSSDPMNCSYQNALQDLVTSSNLGLEFASLRQKSCDETGHGSWVVGGSELLLLPGYTDQLRLNQWGGEHQVDFPAVKDGCNNRERVQAVDNSNHTQALSLSLSSVPSPKTDKDSFHSRNVTAASDVDQDTRAWKKPGIPGPLGPFTGYATILTSSKFLRPAQQLLEECCCTNSDIIEVHDTTKSLEQLLRVSNDGVTNSEPSIKAMAGVSSLAFKDKNQDPGRSSAATSSSVDSHRPQNLHKRAKLLCMQDEVCKRYKQYHQQMQMVVSSFESVAGLSAATPYVSLALKMVAKHFRCLKSVITDQLRSIKNSLGEELSSPSCGGSNSSKGDASVSMLKFFDQNFQKQKGGGSLEGPHIWRPQRGLPERAVSILRAWLFDHFLHPYPTDTDKHMLASQTGLTRNQVSNWFINARVRVWKPMVEEIHMLERKGAVEAGAEGGKTRVEGGEEMNESNQCMSRLRMNAMAEKQVECSSMSMSTSMSPSEHVGRPNPTNIWRSQDKRSRIEYHIPSSIDGSLMGLVPSHHGGIELARGLSSVSLTLGLRQSAENGQRPPEHHLRPHFGHNIIRDFVG